MHAINISPEFTLSFVHSVVGFDYYPWKRHTQILALPPESRHHGSPAIVGANRSRSFFIGKKGVNSKQKVFSAMGSHAPGAYHLMTSFAVEQSATSMSEIGPAHASSFNQIPSMRHQPWTFARDHVLPGFFGTSQYTRRRLNFKNTCGNLATIRSVTSHFEIGGGKRISQQ
jgi:hypothetical protein